MKRIFIDLEMNSVGKDRKKIRQICTQEVIEFGAICLDENLKETDIFQSYVKPEYNDEIAKHITELTGIKTCDIADADPFAAVFEKFRKWCETDYEIYSWSDTDLRQLKKEIKLKDISESKDIRYMFGHWKDLQKEYDDLIFCQRQVALKMAISNAGIDFKGRAHNALTDARATADLYREMKSGNRLRKVRDILENAKRPLVTCIGDLLVGRFAFE